MLRDYARDLCRMPGFGDTVDFDHIKRHYYRVHAVTNPTGIVPLGPDLTGWTAPHHHEELGGRRGGPGRRASPSTLSRCHPPAMSSGRTPAHTATMER
jgi:putative glutathione S-transferase